MEKGLKSFAEVMAARWGTAPQPIPTKETCISEEKEEACKAGKQRESEQWEKAATGNLETSGVGNLTHQIKAGLSDKRSLLQSFKG